MSLNLIDAIINEAHINDSVLTIEYFDEHGHPWNNTPGYDLFSIKSSSPSEMAKFAIEIKRHLWLCWIGDDQEAWYYRAINDNKPWKDLNGHMVGRLI